MSSLRRIVFTTSVALLASLIGIFAKYNVPLPNPLRLWFPSSIHSDDQFGLFVVASGVDPIVE
jgi:hypothetical protein